MKYLLDTHVVLWMAQNSPLLSLAAKQAILDKQSQKYVSIVSAWEVAIKLGTGKLRLEGGLDEFFRIINENGLIVLNIEIHTFESVEMFAFLDNIHLAWSPNYNSVEQYPEVFVDFKNHHQIYSVESYYDGWCSYELPYENVIFVKSEKDMLIGDYKATINKMVGDPFYDDVYNIEVEDFHTYYVGKAGILSHDLTSIATYKYMPHQN